MFFYKKGITFNLITDKYTTTSVVHRKPADFSGNGRLGERKKQQSTDEQPEVGRLKSYTGKINCQRPKNRRRNVKPIKLYILGAKYTCLIKVSHETNLKPALYPATLTAPLQRGPFCCTFSCRREVQTSPSCRLTTRIADLANRQSLFTGFPALKTAPPSITSIISIQYFAAGIQE